MGALSSTPWLQKPTRQGHVWVRKSTYHQRRVDTLNRQNSKLTKNTKYAAIGSIACGAVLVGSYLVLGKRPRVKISKLEKELQHVKEEAIRVKKRSEIDVKNSKKYGYEKFAKSLLTVSDNLDNAIDPRYRLTDPDNGGDPSANMQNLLTGVELTRDSLQKSFSEFGIEKINPLGEKFDPTLGHEAVKLVSSSESEHPRTCTWSFTMWFQAAQWAWLKACYSCSGERRLKFHYACIHIIWYI